jgi:hypothetical protein
VLERLRLLPEPTSVRLARRFVVDKLQEWGCDELVDSAALITSELVTNAIVHTGQPFSVSIKRRGGSIRVEIADEASELPPQPGAVAPVGSPPEPTSSRGRHGHGLDENSLFSGLGMVDAMATRWGSDAVPEGGKVVWFELVPGRRDASRPAIADLRDLRYPSAPHAAEGLGTSDGGKGGGDDPPTQEAQIMARHQYVVDEDDRVIDERETHYVERPRGGAMRWILAILVVTAAIVIGFLLLGGSADVDTEGDLEVPEVDVDVNAPDVDVSTEEAPPADAEAG